MPAPRASRLASRKSLAQNPKEFQVESSPEIPPTASTSAAPALRRSNRLSLDNSTPNDTPPIVKKSSKSTKAKVVKEVKTVKRRRSGVISDADDEAFEEEDSKIDATRNSKRKSRDATIPILPIKFIAKVTNPTVRSRGVVPRAAKSIKKPPPTFSSRLADFTEDSDNGFEFTTHPPTPGATLYSNKKGKRVAEIVPETRPTKSSRRIAQPPISPPPKNPQSTPGKISTRESDIPNQYDPNTDGMIGINIAETPIGIKNLVMRSGSGGRSNGRRESLDKRGKRGSSIGDGFTALPHPDVPSKRLYRATQPSAPPAIRLRSVVSWTSQRQRDLTFPESNGSGSEASARNSRSKSKGPTEVEKRFSKTIVDGFIKGICGKVIDCSWKDSVEEEPKSKKKLAPHPQNVFDDEQYTNLVADLADIEQEENDREPISNKYVQFHQNHRATIASTSKLTAYDPSTVNFEVELPELNNLEDVLSFGSKLMTGAIVENGKGKGKAKAKVVKVQDTLEEDLKAVRLQAANFHRLTYRLSQFTLQSSTYITERISQSHKFLTKEAKNGLNFLPIAEVYERKRGGVGPISEVIEMNGGASTNQNGASGRGRLEPRDLIRAIAFADGSK